MILSLIPNLVPPQLHQFTEMRGSFVLATLPITVQQKVFWESNEEEVDTIYTCRIYVWFLGNYLIFFYKKLSNNAASCIFSSGNLSWKF